MVAVTWIATALVVVLAVLFAWYLLGLRELPTVGRAKLPRFDRFGEELDRAETEPPRRA